VRFDRLDPAPFSIDIGTSEDLVLNMNGGDDNFSATGNLAALIQITVDGGAGGDTILGSNGIDLFLGGDGNDIADGNQGNDVAFLGAGDEVFIWDPGDGSDVVEGQAGTDTMRFNGANIAELFEFAANGGRLRFTRNVGNIIMDTDDVERVEVNALGGPDAITVNDLSGTDVSAAVLNLAGAPGAGDGQADIVTVNGTNGNDTVTIASDRGGTVTVSGLRTTVTIRSAEGAQDTLRVSCLAGVDTVGTAGLAVGVIQLALLSDCESAQ
jgi:hypothetical protein